jgi:hypothetical protein
MQLPLGREDYADVWQYIVGYMCLEIHRDYIQRAVPSVDQSNAPIFYAPSDWTIINWAKRNGIYDQDAWMPKTREEVRILLDKVLMRASKDLWRSSLTGSAALNEMIAD